MRVVSLKPSIRHYLLFAQTGVPRTPEGDAYQRLEPADLINLTVPLSLHKHITRWYSMLRARADIHMTLTLTMSHGHHLIQGHVSLPFPQSVSYLFNVTLRHIGLVLLKFCSRGIFAFFALLTFYPFIFSRFSGVRNGFTWIS